MERMKKEKESGTLLGVGTAYLQAKEIKGEFYVKVSDFNICMDGIRIEQEADRKHIEELEEENQKLKSDLAYERTMLDNVRAEYESLQNVIKKLKEDVEYFRQIYLDLKKMCEDDGYLLTDEEVTKLFNLDEIK